MVPLAGMVDTAFLGHLPQIRHLAGVGLAAILFDYVYWTFGFLRMGTTGVTAQAHGRRDREEVVLTLLRACMMSVGIGLTIWLAQEPLREIGFSILSGTQTVEAAGREYWNGRILAAPFTLTNFVLIGWFLGREQSGRVLVLSAVGGFGNIVLDYLLIVRLGMSSYGAGLATAMSQMAMFVVGLSFTVGEWRIARKVARRTFDAQALRRLLALNRDLMIRTLALITTLSVFTNTSSVLGTAFLAATTILERVITMASYFIDGVAFAVETLAGIFESEGRDKSPLLRFAMGTGIAAGVTFALAFAVFPTTLFALLTDHADVLAIIYRHVWWLLPTLFFGAAAYVLDGYFIGLTKGAWLRKSMVTSALLGAAPVTIVAYLMRSTHLLWVGLVMFMVMRAWTLWRLVPRTLNQSPME
ncbi:MAG: MATE family efflux transporter [Deltaproteobacteria bacterium]|nr:MATE family efflux transporter [Deltaproteobacteria bacterium]MCB9489639.1 MATE family efflux transporter [Deltaproteobacteria bacterium]